MKQLIFPVMVTFLFLILGPPSLAKASEEGSVLKTEQDVVTVKLKSGEEIDALYFIPFASSLPFPKPGDRVIVSPNKAPSTESPSYVIEDYSRTRPIIIFGLIFVIVTLLIAKMWGIKSFIGMLISFYFIFKLLLPQLMAGQDPVSVAIVTACLIVPLTFYLSHGFNRKTNAAILGTFISLIITGVLAVVSVNLSHLTGLSSEEAGFLFAFMGETINTQGLLIAGIIIGTLGVLDDVTISQAAIVQELKHSNPKLSARELFLRAMRVGHDHISSMVNTLILVYTGASLPLLLLFLDSSLPLSSVINHELIAEEIIRTLVSSTGLVLAVPLTTAIATFNGFSSRR